jgi:hypothetical protein
MSNKFKKIVAFVSAAALTMTMSGMAFADEETTETTETTVASTETETVVDTTATSEETTEVETVKTYGGVEAEVIAQYGDINGDNAVNSIDAVYVLKYYAEYLIDKTLTLDEYLSDGEESTEKESVEESVEETVAVASNTSDDETEIQTETSVEETETVTEEAVPVFADFDGDGHTDSREAVSILQFYAAVIIKSEPAYSASLKYNVKAEDETETVEATEVEESTEAETTTEVTESVETATAESAE